MWIYLCIFCGGLNCKVTLLSCQCNHNSSCEVPHNISYSWKTHLNIWFCFRCAMIYYKWPWILVCVWSRQCCQMLDNCHIYDISANKDVSIILCSCIYNNSEMCCSQFIDNENNIRVTRTPSKPTRYILYNTNGISYNENTTYYSTVEIYQKQLFNSKWCRIIIEHFK